MVFSSNIFLFAFLPAVLAIYFCLPRGLRNTFLFLASTLFYFWGSGPVIFVFLICIIINHYSGVLIHRANPYSAKLLLITVLTVDISVLLYYKYFNFLTEQLAILLNFFDLKLPTPSIDLPIGVSFFIFQAMSYPIEVYRREENPARSLVDFGAYLSLFPQLIAGPIVRYSDVSRELVRRSETIESFFSGIIRFAQGLAKKVVIANSLGSVADRILNLPQTEMTTALMWIAIFAYAFQIYYDFSGYSDMAVGMGRFFGFNFPENFNQPYRSRSITEFWRRWHMTLSFWFRDFLYVPLGGSRKGPVRTYFNLFIVFLLCGLWHGAAWNFVVWGLYHGLLLIFERFLSNRYKIALKGVFGNLLTFFLVTMGWVIFRAPDLTTAKQWFQMLFAFQWSAADFQYFTPRYFLQNDTLFYFTLAVFFAWVPVERIKSLSPVDSSGLLIARATVALLLIVYSAAILSTTSFNPFIYYRF